MATTHAPSFGFPEGNVRTGALPRPLASAQPMWKLRHGWVLLIPMLFIAVDGRFSFLNAAQNTYAGGQGVGAGNADAGIAARIVLYCMISVIGVLILPHLSRILTSLMRLKALALLTVLPILSTAWSVDRFVTLKESIWLLISTLFAVYFAEHLEPQRQLQVLWMTGVAAALASIPLALLVPSIGVSHLDGTGTQWQGIFAHKNVCASSMFFLLLSSLYMRAETQLVRIAKVFSVLLFLGLIAMTHSVTGLLITTTLLVVFPALRILGKFRLLDRLLIAFVILGVSAFVITFLSLNMSELLRYVGRDASFSGRTAIWHALILSAWKRPLLGYGYHAFWQGLTGESASVLIAVHWIMGYAHNGLLDLWIGVGLVSLGLFFLSLIKGLRDAVTSFRVGQPGYLDLYVSILVYNVLYSVDEAYLLFSFNIVWFLYIVSCVSLDREARSRRLSSQSAAPSRGVEITAQAGGAG
jgi:O-antigen ligase